jgi:hypothetical protein
MADQVHWFGRRPPRQGIAAAWGARTIVKSTSVELSLDRQSWSDSDPEAHPRLKKWINEKGLPWLRAETKGLSLVASTVLIHDEGDFHIEASPQRSGGYLYIGAWLRTCNSAPPKELAVAKARKNQKVRVTTKADQFEKRKQEHLRVGYQIQDEQPVPINGLCSFTVVRAIADDEVRE